MPLQKQLVPVVVPQGVNTKVDSKLLPMQQAAKLDNWQVSKQGEIKKRNGFDTLKELPINNGARGVFDLDGRLLVATEVDLSAAGDGFSNIFRLQEYNPTKNSYIDRGSFSNFRHQIITQTYDDEEQSQISVASVGGYYVVGCVAYRGSSLQGVRVLVFDGEPTSTLITSFIIASQDRVKVCFRNTSSVYVTTALTGNANLNTRILSLVDMSLSGATITAATLSTTQPNFDVKYNARAGKSLVLWNTGTNVIMAYLTSTGAQEPSPTPVTFTSHNGSGCVSLCVEDTYSDLGYIGVFYARDTGGAPYTVTYYMMPINWVNLASATAGPWTYTPSGVVTQITCNVLGVNQRVALQVTGSLVSFQPINAQVLIVEFGPLSTLLATIRSVGLRSEAIGSLVAVAHESVLQPTGFLYDLFQLKTVAKFNALESGGLAGARGAIGTSGYILARSCLSPLFKPILTSFPSSQLTLFTTTKTGLISQAGQLFGTRNIARIDFSSESPPQGVVSRGLYLSGSQVDFFDGRQLAEAGFYLFPENVTSTAIAAGTAVAGAYGWAVTYSFEDAYGNRWESTPQLGSTTLALSQQIELVVPTLRLTNKTGVVINTYRTVANGSILYRCEAITGGVTYSPTNPLFNSTSTDNITLTLNPPSPDTAIESNAILYTTGGVLENDQAPSCSHISLYRGRMVYTGLEKKYQLAYSKFFTSFEPANFNAAYTLEAGSEDLRAEGLKASQTLDDKLLLFAPTAILALSGQGPLNTGLQSDFDRPVLIATDVGSTNPNSIVLYSQGVLFQSLKGIYQIDRGLQVSYIGAPVEDYKGLTITSASLIDNKNEVRFTSVGTNPSTLVFNYFFNQWMTHSQLPANAGGVVGGVHTLCLTDGRVVQETEGYSDSGVIITSTLETGWLASALQGYQRVYRFLFVGDVASTTDIMVSIGYDYNTYQSEFYRVISSQMFPQLGLGESNFGVGLFGGEYHGYAQFMVMPSTQKCQAIKIKLIDSPSSEDVGAGFRLSAITAQVGAKVGTQKLPASQRAAKV